MATPKVTKDITTGIGTLSFPHLFKAQAEQNKNDKGEVVYDCQFIIPKMVGGAKNPAVREIMAAIKEVGEAKWGDNYRKVRIPLRDGDKEADDLTEDGSTKRDKYPERLGCYFLNARSSRPVGVVNRKNEPIVEEDDVYGGCKVRIHISFYPYSNSGNHGIGVGLNGVQKVADGESFGGGRPSVESMFDMLDDDEDAGLEDEGDAFDALEEDEPTPPPAKKAAAKKAPAKKAAAKKAAPAPAPVEEAEDVDLLEADGDDTVDEEWDDL